MDKKTYALLDVPRRLERIVELIGVDRTLYILDISEYKLRSHRKEGKIPDYIFVNDVCELDHYLALLLLNLFPSVVKDWLDGHSSWLNSRTIDVLRQKKWQTALTAMDAAFSGTYM